MSKPLNILFVSSEVEPFAKTGGLADVSNSLPQAIKEQGHEIRIMMPRYKFINERRFKLHDIIRLKDIPVPIGNTVEIGNVKSSFITNQRDKVQVYFLDNEKYFGRDGIYQAKVGKKDYKDNDERFTFFCRGVMETLTRLGWLPDVIHCNDWQTGLIPVYLKTLYSNQPFFKTIKTIFTIHNMAYQGSFPAESFAKTKLPKEVFHLNGVEAFGKLNFLKAALAYADSITTVSEKYADEICSSEEYGAGLNGYLATRRKDLSGIINGIDHVTWDPNEDNYIYRRYDVKSLEAKAENKRALLSKYKLSYDSQTPLIGAISRLVDQKGFDLVASIMDDMMKLGVQFILLGTGNEVLEKRFEAFAKKYPKQFVLVLGLDTELAHNIEAGADIFLMPSRYEPCGLNQMYSMRYGTVPIVRDTGGLSDTVEQYTGGGKGTGFKFEKYDGKELLKTIQRAMKVYHQPDEWKKIMRNGMVQDFSWDNSAKKYVNVYKNLHR